MLLRARQPRSQNFLAFGESWQCGLMTAASTAHCCHSIPTSALSSSFGLCPGLLLAGCCQVPAAPVMRLESCAQSQQSLAERHQRIAEVQKIPTSSGKSRTLQTQRTSRSGYLSTKHGMFYPGPTLVSLSASRVKQLVHSLQHVLLLRLQDFAQSDHIFDLRNRMWLSADDKPKQSCCCSVLSTQKKPCFWMGVQALRALLKLGMMHLTWQTSSNSRMNCENDISCLSSSC